MSEELQSKLQSEVDKFKALQKDYQKAVAQRQQLDGQLNENSIVKQELDLLKPDAEVYKLIGPVLVKQNMEEAKQNVAKRMDFIRNELKRLDDNLANLSRKQDVYRESISKLQQQFQEVNLKTALQAKQAQAGT